MHGNTPNVRDFVLSICGVTGQHEQCCKVATHQFQDVTTLISVNM